MTKTKKTYFLMTNQKGDFGCFSFHPRKSITTGEGGMITTNDKELITISIVF